MNKRLILLTLVFCAACSGSKEAHYAEVEKHREAQAAQPSSSTPAPSPSPSASVSPSPGQTATVAATASSRNYWTNFRGPKRDGKYDEASISTNWPAKGLPLLWKQPVGIGHSSFVVADGKAYTIEQR